MSEITVGAQESGSLPRMNGSAKDFVRGSLNNRPFRPGGLDDSQSVQRIPDGVTNGEWVRELLSGGPSQAIPPGFKQGLDLGDLKVNYISLRLKNCKIVLLCFSFCSCRWIPALLIQSLRLIVF